MVAYVCGRNRPGMPAIVGLCGTVVDAMVAITTGPHAKSTTYKKTYKPTSNALPKFCKIVVTRARAGLLATLPYPRSNVLCNSCTAGDVLWLPMASVRQVDCDDETHSPRHETNIPPLDVEFHDQSTFCFDDLEETKNPCPFTHLED
jgi:hypothetical protein